MKCTVNPKRLCVAMRAEKSLPGSGVATSQEHALTPAVADRRVADKWMVEGVAKVVGEKRLAEWVTQLSLLHPRPWTLQWRASETE